MLSRSTLTARSIIAAISSSENGSNQVAKIAMHFMRSGFQQLFYPKRALVHRGKPVAAFSSPLSGGQFPAGISYRRHSPRLWVQRVKSHSSSQSSGGRSQLLCLLFPEVPFPALSTPGCSMFMSSGSKIILAFRRFGSLGGFPALLLQFGLHPSLFSLVALVFKHLRPTMQCIGPAGCSRLLPEAKVAPTHRAADCRRWAAASVYSTQSVPSVRLVR